MRDAYTYPTTQIYENNTILFVTQVGITYEYVVIFLSARIWKNCKKICEKQRVFEKRFNV